MKVTLFAVLGVLMSAGCGGGSASAPSPPPAPPTGGGGATLILSGIVYGVDAAGRRPLAGATVDISESGAAWGTFGRPATDANGRYVFGSLSARHYVARANRTGYDDSPVVTIGYLDTSRTLDFELMTTGLTSAPLTIASIDQTVGSTEGGTPVIVTGTGFRTPTTVAFGADQGTVNYVLNSTTLYTTTPAHAAGTVNVIVTRPGGDVATLTGGFRFAAAQTFNFNGTWTGYALAHPLRQSVIRRHSDMEMQFTIEGNALVRFTCGGAAVAGLEPAPAVSSGAFSLAGAGLALSGRIVSPATSIGTINTTACPATRWEATRQ